jgi:hypothetical protein
LFGDSTPSTCEVDGCLCLVPNAGGDYTCCPDQYRCVETATDARNCGACDNVCDSGICIATDAGGVCGS